MHAEDHRVATDDREIERHRLHVRPFFGGDIDPQRIVLGAGIGLVEDVSGLAEDERPGRALARDQPERVLALRKGLILENDVLSKRMRDAESAPGCQMLSHFTSAPNSSRPRATGRLYSMSMFVWLTRCDTVPCWLNGTPCITPNDAVAATAQK